MKQSWVDISSAGDLAPAICAEAVHLRVDAIVADDPAALAALPPTVTRVLLAADGELPAELGDADVVIVDTVRAGGTAELAGRHPGVAFGRLVDIVDRASLDEACRSARGEAYSVLRFRDPTKIPLEIVLAARAGSKGCVITVAADPVEATVLYGVLEQGSDGVLLAPSAVGDVTRLVAAAQDRPEDLELVELEVTAVTPAGMGERACVDTCAILRPDEGILVGSHARGLILGVSETHRLPYMPTRPFRVNAGAVMSYTMGAGGRTQYLTELHAGSQVLVVDAKGHTRLVTVGRTKIETRPLLCIDAVSRTGVTVNLIVQDDWHVRVLGPGGAVLNSTELRPGDLVLGHLPVGDRHVGYPIDEFCLEQ